MKHSLMNTIRYLSLSGIKQGDTLLVSLNNHEELIEDLRLVAQAMKVKILLTNLEDEEKLNSIKGRPIAAVVFQNAGQLLALYDIGIKNFKIGLTTKSEFLTLKGLGSEYIHQIQTLPTN